MVLTRRHAGIRALMAFFVIGALLLSQFMQVHVHVGHAESHVDGHHHSYDVHADLFGSDEIHEGHHASATQLDYQDTAPVKQLPGALALALFFTLLSCGLLFQGRTPPVPPRARHYPPGDPCHPPQNRAPPCS